MKVLGRRTVGLLAGAFAALLAPHAGAQATFNIGGATAYSAPVTSLRDMPFKTVVRQQFDYSCGSAALATLLKYHLGRPVSEAQVFNAMYAVGDQPKIREVGFSLLDMKTYLETIGLAADGYRETIGGLSAIDGPAIVVIKVGAYRHFVVLKGVRNGQALIGDPAQGIREIELPKFAEIWNGVVFVVHPPQGGVASFNQTAEWETFPHATLRPVDNATLASVTRNLPPIYQITPVRGVGQ